MTKDQDLQPIAAMAQACGWAVTSSWSCTAYLGDSVRLPCPGWGVGGLPERWACSWGKREGIGVGEEGESSTMCSEARNIMWPQLLYST